MDKLRSWMPESVPETTKLLSKYLQRITGADGDPSQAVDDYPGAPTSRIDEPASIDLLGRKPLVDALAAMFCAPDQATPFTVGLLGEWGAGKSSILRLVEDRLEESAPSLGIEFDFARFNAWEYERTQNLSAGLAQEVVRGLVEGARRPTGRMPESVWLKPGARLLRNVRGYFGQLGLRINFAAREYGWRFLRWPVIALIAALVILTQRFWFAQLPGPEALQIPEGSIDSPWAVLALWGAILSGLWYVWQKITDFLDHPLAVQLDTYLKLPDYGEHLGLIPVLRRQIHTLCEMRLGPQGLARGDFLRRLIVYVDDLDRCDPDCIVETLDAIRLVMDRPHVIVVVAMDHRIALKAVAEHYQALADEERSSEAIARDYVGKIIQLPIRLQDPSPQSISQFVSKRLFAATESVAPQSKRQGVPPQRPAGGPPEKASSTDPGRPTQEQASSTDQGTVRNAVPPPVSIIDRRRVEQMKHDTPERDLFVELANVLSIDNPRQLTRLANSYRLLKAISFDAGDALEVIGATHSERNHNMMRLLFWQEFLGSLGVQQRAVFRRAALDGDFGDEFESTVGSRAGIAIAERLKANSPLLRAIQNSENTAIESWIEAVVLPQSLRSSEILPAEPEE
jgi:hypothetical protein